MTGFRFFIAKFKCGFFMDFLPDFEMFNLE